MDLFSSVAIVGSITDINFINCCIIGCLGSIDIDDIWGLIVSAVFGSINVGHIRGLILRVVVYLQVDVGSIVNLDDDWSWRSW